MRINGRALIGIRFTTAVAAIAAAGLFGCGGSDSPPAPTYTIGGTVTGLSGTGLLLQLTYGSNLTSNLPVSTSGFTFAPALGSGATYTVSVLTQPTSPSQTCAVTSGSPGTVASANVADVIVSCTTNSFMIGGTVSGLYGTGLVLRLNGGNDLPIGAEGGFTFTSTPILSGTTYAVTVFAQPATPTQTCTVTNDSGTVGAANVTSVRVTCTFTISALADPLALEQWHLKNTGQTAFADGVGVVGMDINVEPVYSSFGYTGADVTVAVVDSGLEIAHEDLAANVVLNGSWNFIDGSMDPTNTVDTTGDHGTEVGGLISMARNTVGGIGVAPAAKLKGFNFLSSPNQFVSELVDSLGGSTASPDSSDVFVFNQSFGISPTNDTPVNTTVEAQYLSGVTTLRGAKGALYVKAAGNGFSDMGITSNANCDRAFGPILAGLSCENASFDPSNALPYQIVVGAMNADGIKASYSTAGSALWVSAPGGEFGLNAAVFGPGAPPEAYEPAMVTTDQSGCTIGSSRTAANTSAFNNGSAQNTACNYTNTMNGTSSATPVTAGAISLILEANPALTWRDVKHILASTARQIDAARAAVSLTLSNGSYVAEPAWTTNFANVKFHNWYGFGMVDASAAVNMARTYNLAQLGTFVNTGLVSSPTLGLSIPDDSVTGASNTINVPGTTVQTVEAVQISVTATHPFTGDLAIELTSPSLTRSVLKTGDDGFGGPDLNGMVLLSNAFYGEPAAGNWTIKVVDVAPGDIGTLTNWKIRVFGH